MRVDNASNDLETRASNSRRVSGYSKESDICRTLRGDFHGITTGIARRGASRSCDKRPKRHSVPKHDASCELSHEE